MFRPILLAVMITLFCGVLFSAVRLTPLENFDSGSVVLSSWADEDIDPDAWSLDAGTPDASPWCLKITGNTWKYQQITPHAIDSVGVIQLKVKHTNNGKLQGIGFNDGVHQLFYSFSGNAVANIETWVPVYQGANDAGVWNTYQLPLASDWQAFFEYIPVLSGIIYVNDMDGVTNRTVYFDAIEDISSDLPVPPRVTVSAGPPTLGKNVGINFSSTVFDPDSSVFSYAWDFGDSTFSAVDNPYHLYTDAAGHTYTVTLKVTDDTGKSGYASTIVSIDPGPSTMPVSMNFVGDVMLARAYEQAGGIIPTYGVNSIFLPTRAIYGDAAEINVANLEVVLSDVGVPHPTKSVKYRGSPSNISGLVFAGIDVVSTANNHTLDYGLSALQQMSNLLRSNNILFSGSGANSYDAYEPTFVNRRGLNIAFLRNCDRTGQYNNAQPYLQAGYNKPGFAYMTPYYISQQIQAVNDVADLKIVEMHGGSEYSLAPGSGYDKGNPYLEDTQDEDYSDRSDVPHQWDIDIRHGTIDSGADLVIVHHPHIIQGLEVYNNKLIAHSLGNFVFDLDYPETMPSMILYADADFSGFRNYKVKPVFIDGYIPKPATGQLGLYILDYLAQRSRELNTRLWVDRESMEARVLMTDDNPMVRSSAFALNQSLTGHDGSINYTPPIKLARRGSISEISAIEPFDAYELRLGQEKIWYGNFENEGSSFWVPPAYETALAFDGERSAKLSTTGTSTVTSTIPKRTKIYDNTTKFTMHGWIKTENSGGANIIVRYFNARTTGNAISTENVTTSITGNTDWAYYYKELSIPSNAYYYDIRLSNTGNGTAGVAYFDNVGLIEWTPWQASAEYNAVAWPNNYYWMQAKTSGTMKSVTLSGQEKSYEETLIRSNSVMVKPKPSLEISPNPFNPSTTIFCSLPQAAESKIRIYNLKGQHVMELHKGLLEAGKHSFIWNGKDDRNRAVASGIYFVRIEHGSSSVVRKAVLLK